MDESIEKLEREIELFKELLDAAMKCERCSILFRQAAINHKRSYSIKRNEIIQR